MIKINRQPESDAGICVRTATRGAYFRTLRIRNTAAIDVEHDGGAHTRVPHEQLGDFENMIDQHLGLEQSQRRFIGPMRESCKPRLGLRALYYLNMTDDTEFDLGIARLATQLRECPERKDSYRRHHCP
jgi:hypothetical protein